MGPWHRKWDRYDVARFIGKTVLPKLTVGQIDLPIDAFAPGDIAIGVSQFGVKIAAGLQLEVLHLRCRAFGASQWASCSGLVHASQTLSREAPKTRFVHRWIVQGSEPV